jgi:hypothetical protein
MTRVLLLVEGQTEEAFVNHVLRPHPEPLGIYIGRPSLLRTKELPEGRPYKGGVTTYRQMSRDTQRLLGDSGAFVTTLIDYYGLPADFPGLATARALADVNDRVEALEKAFGNDINHPRFYPFLALHELEAWIFAAPEAAEDHLAITGLGNELANVASDAGGAERVNDGPSTHPSIRLAMIVQRLATQHRYGKVADGPETIAKAGLPVIRTACPHFGGWLDWLESLG